MNECAARDPPFSLFRIGAVTDDGNRRKRIKCIPVNLCPPSIARLATTLFNLEAAAVDGEDGGT